MSPINHPRVTPPPICLNILHFRQLTPSCWKSHNRHPAGHTILNKMSLAVDFGYHVTQNDEWSHQSLMVGCPIVRIDAFYGTIRCCINNSIGAWNLGCNLVSLIHSLTGDKKIRFTSAKTHTYPNPERTDYRSQRKCYWWVSSIGIFFLHWEFGAQQSVP